VLTVLGAQVPPPADNANARLKQAFTRMVQSLCEDRPHSFAWDVAHAMDPESFVVLDEVLRRLRQSRLVFVFAARAGFSHPFEKGAGASQVEIDLADLVPSEVERLIGLRLAIDAVPDDLLRFVRARAGGHPLFVEEVIKGLVEAGAITVVERHAVAMNLAGQDMALPKTLRGLVASRVARLTSADRATLQAAAVLGDPIDVNVLSNMLGEAVPSLEKSLAKLKQHDFVVDRGPSELRFASPIVPEIVVDALTLEAAREMHAAAGQALETTLGARAVEHAARIATHLYEAGDRERAASYFAKSGERRWETRQLEAAARDYARAITLAEPARRSPEELTSWLVGLATAVRVVRSLPDVTELCQRVTERVDHGADTEEGRQVRVSAHVAAAHIFTAMQQMAQAQQRLAHAEAVAADDAELRKPVLVAGAELAIRQGKYERAWQLLTELGRIGAVVTEEREKFRVALLAAQASAGRGDRDAALLSLVEAEHLLPDDRMASVERTRVRARVEHFTKDFRSAVLHGEMAVDLAREAGLSYEVMFNLHNLGVVFIRLDEHTRAYGAVRQSLELCEEYSYERFANFNRMLLAFLDGIEGTADADKLLLVGIAYAESKQFTMEVVTGYLLLAKLFHRRGRLENAKTEYERACALALEAGHRIVVDECEPALSTLRAS